MPAKPEIGKRLEHMTWQEAEVALRECEVVLIPLGARCKEHGPHLPLNNDWLMAEYLARRILETCDVVAIPTIEHSFYPAFTEYPGSIHISLETSRDYLADICRSLARFGPQKFYVLNTGISTIRALAPARDLLAKEGLRLEFTDMHQVGTAARKQVRESEGGTHADEVETSMMLYIAPEVVNMKLAQKDFHADKGAGGLTRDPHSKTGTYSPTGTWGDPTLATREKGEIVVEALVKDLISSIQSFSADLKENL